jgi:hypothetical protein
MKQHIFEMKFIRNISKEHITKYKSDNTTFYATKCVALTTEIDCNKTAMGLPPVTSAVFLIAN